METITAKQVPAILEAALPFAPVFIHGPNGIGKTAVLNHHARRVFKSVAIKKLQYEAKMGERNAEVVAKLIEEIKSLEPHQIKLVDDVRLGNIDLLDLSGLPHVVDEQMKRAVGDFWPQRDPITGEKIWCILYVDEFTQGGREKQTACQQLTDTGKIGSFILAGHKQSDPNCEHGLVLIVGSGNRQKDRANSHGMGMQTGTRWTHFTMMPDLDSWLEWADTVGLNPLVTSFNKMMTVGGEPYLFKLDPAQKHEHPTGPCPRTWERLAHVLDAGLSTEIERPVIEGIVGEEAAVAFIAVKHAAQAVDVEQALTDPTNATIPQETGHQFAAASLLIRLANASNFGNIITYLSRIGEGEFTSPEILVFVVEAIKRRQVELADTKEYRDFALQWADIRS
tara:strand:+ start:1011 stop:2195 length:1185 start_codon:yes stop_codon:yes gene_type:complete